MWSNRKRKNTSEQEWSLITMVVILSHVWTYDHVSLHFFLTLAQSLIIMKCKFHWWEGLCFRLGEITAQACMLKKYFNQYINTGILTYLSKQTSFHVNSLFCCFHFKSSEELFPFLRFFFFKLKIKIKDRTRRALNTIEIETNMWQTLYVKFMRWKHNLLKKISLKPQV